MKVIDYNQSLELYRPDLDWKKHNMVPPTDKDVLYEYHLRIGQANQKVAALVLLERVLGQYIATVGEEIVRKQADTTPAPIAHTTDPGLYTRLDEATSNRSTVHIPNMFHQEEFCQYTWLSTNGDPKWLQTYVP